MAFSPIGYSLWDGATPLFSNIFQYSFRYMVQQRYIKNSTKQFFPYWHEIFYRRNIYRNNIGNNIGQNAMSVPPKWLNCSFSRADLWKNCSLYGKRTKFCTIEAKYILIEFRYSAKLNFFSWPHNQGHSRSKTSFPRIITRLMIIYNNSKKKKYVWEHF